MPDELADREVWLETQLTRLTCYLVTFVQYLLFYNDLWSLVEVNTPMRASYGLKHIRRCDLTLMSFIPTDGRSCSEPYVLVADGLKAWPAGPSLRTVWP